MQPELERIAKSEPQVLLTAFGSEFQPDLFLKDSVFDPARILFAGTQEANTFEWIGEGYHRERRMIPRQTLIVGVSQTGTRAEQIEKAIIFLRHYEKELLRLGDFHGVEMVLLNRPRSLEDTDSHLPDELQEAAISAKVSLLI